MNENKQINSVFYLHQQTNLPPFKSHTHIHRCVVDSFFRLLILFNWTKCELKIRFFFSREREWIDCVLISSHQQWKLHANENKTDARASKREKTEKQKPFDPLNVKLRIDIFVVVHASAQWRVFSFCTKGITALNSLIVIYLLSQVNAIHSTYVCVCVLTGICIISVLCWRISTITWFRSDSFFSFF